jgi:hypothetical protein
VVGFGDRGVRSHGVPAYPHAREQGECRGAYAGRDHADHSAAPRPDRRAHTDDFEHATRYHDANERRAASPELRYSDGRGTEPARASGAASSADRTNGARDRAIDRRAIDWRTIDRRTIDRRTAIPDGGCTEATRRPLTDH